MPAKSRRKRGKYSAPGKRTGGPVRSRATQPGAAQAGEPTSQSTQGERPRPRAAASSSGRAAPPAKPASVQYPYIGTELRTIAILTGIMLFILVMLALILS